MIIKLYRKTESFTHNCGYYKTDASDSVIENIIKDIKKDNKLAINDFGNAVVTILKARGYECEEYEIKSFGYSDLQK